MLILTQSNRWKKLINLFLDFQFLIILFFVIRLFGIMNPPLEVLHSWRQCTGLMIARNFYFVDSNIFYPRIDDLCDNVGIIGSEFQLLTYVHYLISLIFGYEHWYGRLINLVVSSIGVYCFGLVLKRFFNDRMVWFSILSLLASSWLIYSRKMMPDTFSVSLMFIGIYYATAYLFDGKKISLFLFFIFSTLGGLSKIPAAIYFVLYLYIYLFHKRYTSIQITISVLSSMMIILYWYFVWDTMLSIQYKTWMNLGKPLLEGIRDIVTHPKEVFFNIVFYSFSSYILFSLFLWGIYQSVKHKEKQLLIVFGFMGSIFAIYMFKSGYFFYHHSYYMLPFLPIMSLMVGYGLSKNFTVMLYIVFFAGLVESIANQQHDFRIKNSELYKLTLESKLDSLDAGTKHRIIINTATNPQQFYLSNRKGCYVNPEEIKDSFALYNYKKRGYTWLVIDKNYPYLTPTNSVPSFEDSHYLIYRL